MKFDGKNIIKDTDITLTNGKTLSNELKSFQNDIDLLKSNVKFIYKHGTLGGGTYINPDESTNKKLKVVFYMQQTNGLVSIDNNDEVYFSSPGNYNIKLKLYGVTENSRYSADIIYEQGTHLNVNLNSSNNYTYTGSLKLSSNDNIKIDLDADGDLYDGIFKCSYITSIYNITQPKIIPGYKQSNDDVFDINQDKVDQNGLIFMNDYTNTGIVMGFYCNFIIPPLENSSIIFTDWLGNKYDVQLKDLGINTNISSSKPLFFNLTGDNSLSESQIVNKRNIDIKDFLSSSNYAGTYEFRVEFNIRIIDKKGKEHIIDDKYVAKNNLIPNSLFLMVESSKGKLFNIDDSYEEVMSCNLDEKFLLGSTTLYVTPFHGYRDDRRNYTLSAKIFYHYNENTHEFEESKPVLINNNYDLRINDQNRVGISVPLLYSGYYKIQFTLVENNTLETYYGIYFLNVSNIESTFNWFNEAKQYQIRQTSGSHASFKQNYEVHDSDNINVYYKNIRPANKLDSLSSIIMSANDQPKLYRFDITNGQWAIFDQLLEMSIQYSKTNDTSIPIFSLNRLGSDESHIESCSLFVFQDKIICTNEDATIIDGEVNIDKISQKAQAYIYIPISETISYNDKSMYSLLTIYKNMEGLGENNNPKYGIYTLINGIYDGILKTFDYNYGLFDSITFYPGNYAINLMETICLPHYANDLENENNYYSYIQGGSTIKELKYMNQYDFETYFYSYETLYRNIGKNISQSEQNLIKYFSEFTYDEKLQMVRCNENSAKNIAANIDIPVLLLSFMNPVNGKVVNSNVNGLEGWLGAYYSQDAPTGTNIPVQIWWSSSKTSGLQQVNNVVTIGDSDEGSNSSIPEFSFNIQGSSTKGYHCKNIELYGPTPPDQNTKYLYSPNITHNNENSEEFKEMLLPEESFTLKADVVDSSHSNNNAIGAFVNDNLSDFSTAKNIFEKQNVASKYIKKIKKCLTGFPILVFLNTTYKLDENSTENNCYYLGIYNFNLGRESHFNLGYNELNPIVDAIENNPGANGFVIYKFKNRSMPMHSGLFVSEIQYNDKCFDFSQYDESVLYQLPDNPNDNRYMWGDFVYGTNLAEQRDCLSLLMQQISWTGGYIFNKIGKGFSDDSDSLYGYNYWYSPLDDNGEPVENVPNFRHRLQREFVVDQNVYTEKEELSSFSDISFMNALHDTFVNTLSTKKDEYNTPNIPILDYRSVSEYYTTCMAFGMVDSVEKNLNIKSWTTKNTDEPGTFYTAFYDMDTALGITNQGSRMTYFAFSDYWRSKIENNILQQVNIIRDWVTPSQHDGEEVKFFDIPSSYLFAIAKYAPMIQKSDWDSDYRSFYDHPTSIWARWRRSDGCLRNAKWFVDKYFNNHLSKVPISAINWNYKYKYFIKNGSNVGFDDVNFKKFYGTKKAYTENWLSNRLHIMDAYMNISGINQKIGNYYVLCPNELEADESNPDILLFREIFRNPGVEERLRFSKPGTFTFGVKSIPYSPLIIKIDDTTSLLYLSPQTNEQYYLRVEGGYGGEPYISYYGSTNWYFLSDVNKFISDSHSLTINSDYFTDLNGSGGDDTTSCTSWDLTIPAIKNISLTNQLYSGDISLNDLSNYPNLNKVNISNSSINFKTSGTNLSTLIANNMQGSTIECTNVNKLSNVSLSGKFNNIEIEAWSENIYLPAEGYGNIDCPKITIINKRFDTVNVYINNNAILTDVKLENCTSLSLINCPKVQKIIINNDTDKPQFKSFIFNAQDINKVETGFKLSNGKNIDNTRPGVVDLSFCSQLNSLSIQNSYTTKVILPNDENIHINLPSNAFANNLYDFIGFSGNASLYITGPGTFQNCPLLNLFQVNDDNRDINGLYTGVVNNAVTDIPLNLYINSSCKSLASTFACNSKNKGEKMTVEQAASFLDKCTEECVSQVTDISSMFEYQTNIIYNRNDALHEYQAETPYCSLSFKNFRKCSNFDNVFKNTGLEFINRYMFGGNFAADVDSLKYNNVVTNVDYMKRINTTEDFLYEIIDKLTSILMDPTLTIVDPDEEECTPISSDIMYLAKIFNPVDLKTLITKYPKLLTKITKFNISNTCLYDFTDLFNEHWTQANANGLELVNFLSTETYRVYHMNDCGLGNIFEHIKLKKIENVLNNIIGSSTDDRVDISYFMDYKNGISLLNNICYSSLSGSPSLQFAKKVSYTRFKEICDCLLGFNNNPKNTQLNTISYLFYDLQIEEDEQNKVGDHLTLVTDPTKQNTKITNISYLFSKLSIKKLNGLITSVPLTWQTLYCLPNLTTVEHAFSYILLRYPISFDFFHKRTKDSNFESVVVEGNKTAKLYRYKYRHEISNMNYCFANCLLEEAQPFKGDSIYNKDFENHSIINRNYVIDYNNNLYDEYYNNGQYVRVPQPVEITDFEIAEQQNYTTYHEQFLFIGNGQYLTNGRNYGYNNGYSGVFIAPDIFYGCSLRPNISNVFENKNNDEDICFTGTLPLHLLYRDENNDRLDLRTNNSFENSLYNLNILPIKFYQEKISEGDSTCTHTYYYFVPKEFILSTNLRFTFTFKLLLPYQSKDLKEHFFIFMNNSIDPEINSLWDATPKFLSSHEQIGKRSDGDYIINNWYAKDPNRYPIYINIFGNVPLDNNNNLDIEEDNETHDEPNSIIQEGLDMTRYKNLKLDTIFKSEWLNIYYGYIFKVGTIDAYLWKSTYLQQNNTYALNGTFIGLSYYAKIFLPAKNANYFAITVDDYTINRSSIINQDIFYDETFIQSQQRDSNYQNINFVN